MTTLAANKPRTFEGGSRNEFPVAASTTIFEGCAVGIVDATGLARKLNAADRFGGFAEAKADNGSGAASAINVRVIESGAIVLAVSGAVITDVGQPVYATDDDTFVFSPVGGAFVGFVHRFVSAGVVVVSFDALNYRDPYGHHGARVTISADTTIDATYNGKLIWVDTDAKTITLPAIATGVDGVMIVNGGAFGTVGWTVAPNASDYIMGPDITAADNKGIVNSKATARRGDFLVLGGNDADGMSVLESRGTFARVP